MKTIGVLTGGGDAPGLNAAIRAIVITAEKHGLKVKGILDGWGGMLEGRCRDLTSEDVEDMHKVPGTMLGSVRKNPFKIDGGPEKVKENFKKVGIDALIAMGGEDTLGVAAKLADMGAKVVGAPKTIDGDLSATDYTMGFDTGVGVATEAIDRVHATMRSHHRVGVVEVMGRHAGWMTLVSGIASGAHCILLPEFPFEVDEVCGIVKKRKGKHTVIAVAEGAKPKSMGELVTKDSEKDEFGHVKLGGIADILAKEIEERTGVTSRAIVLGHTQRGGIPTARDRLLGTKLGVKVVELLLDGEYGKMASVKGNGVVSVPLKDAVGVLRTVPKEEYELAKLFFG